MGSTRITTTFAAATQRWSGCCMETGPSFPLSEGFIADAGEDWKHGGWFPQDYRKYWHIGSSRKDDDADRWLLCWIWVRHASWTDTERTCGGTPGRSCWWTTPQINAPAAKRNCLSRHIGAENGRWCNPPVPCSPFHRGTASRQTPSDSDQTYSRTEIVTWLQRRRKKSSNVKRVSEKSTKN